MRLETGVRKLLGTQQASLPDLAPLSKYALLTLCSLQLTLQASA